ncbi:MAG: hypothetical protein K2J82_08065 [Muribaculaceae bacterium]|nr:hypothetical protein [Muribaculaceae bacterium]MDE6754551.1 hypothetical protein [Muribaculaceae bacterium]
MKKFWVIFLLTVLLSGCGSDSPLTDSPLPLSLSCSEPVIDSSGRYHTFKIEGLTSDEFTFSLNQPWAYAETDKVGADGIIEFWAETNQSPFGRNLTITLTASANSTLRGEIVIYQKGLGEEGDNSGADPMSDFRLGWGLNAFDEYQSAGSIRGEILNLDLIASHDAAEGFQSLQEVVRSQLDYYCESAASLKEMSALLTQRQDKSSSFLGVTKTIARYSKISKESQTQQYLSYARMSKIVASKSIDAGALQYILEHSSQDQLPFSTGFRQYYDNLLKNPTTVNIRELLNRFGTHIIIEANAGGMIDYVATFNRQYVGNLEEISKEQSSRVFGKKDSQVSKELKASLTSNISSSYSVEVKGGDASLRSSLLKNISNLDALATIPATELQAWFSSIKYTPDNKQNLDLVEFKVYPIWNLFKDASLSQRVMQQVMEMQNQSNCEIPDQDLSTDMYLFSANDSRFNFSDTSNSGTSLVKICYVKNVPVLEICEEYVPKIRSDRRIKVFYPIYNGKTNHAQGLFAGDGEGNRPAHLSFYEGTCYVTPIEEYGAFEKLTDLYYIHGNLYEKDYGNTCNSPSDLKVKDHRLKFNSWTVDYPVVKIGSGYWTRQYITQKMQFGVKGAGGRFMTKEIVTDGLLFADIYQTNNTGFLSPNSSIYGQQTDSSLGKQLFWYLPLSENRKELVEYLGGNMKPLFKGQPTGFDAQFEGYYGSYDENGNDLRKMERRNKNLKCYVPFKDGAASSNGEAFVLSSDYTWKRIVTSTSFNYYPVRLFRTCYFTHQNL